MTGDWFCVILDVVATFVWDYTSIHIWIFPLSRYRQAFISLLSYSRTDIFIVFHFYRLILIAVFFPRTVFFLYFAYQFTNRKYWVYALFDRHLCLSLQFLSYLAWHENPFYDIFHCPTNNLWYKRHYATRALTFLQRRHCSYFSRVSILK